MKTVRIAAIAGIFALAACSESPVEAPLQRSFSSNGAQQSVTGHVDPHFLTDAVNEEYSFSAVRTPDGDVNGRFEVHDVYSDGSMDRVTGTVTCFTILPDGKTARVAGVIESSTNANVPAGMDAVWTVRDNGEGQVADGATDLSWGYPAGSAQQHCATGLRFYKQPFLLSDNGNVQVRP